MKRQRVSETEPLRAIRRLEYVDSLRRSKVDGILVITLGLTLKEKEAYCRLGLPMVILGDINTSINLQENIDLFIDDQLNNCIEITKEGIQTIRISCDKKKKTT